MLSILNRVNAASLSRRTVSLMVALVLPAVTIAPAAPAYADKLIVGGCVGFLFGTRNCVTRIGPPGDPYVRLVPAPEGQAEQDRSAERDRHWMDRCHPTVVQDRYGVPRYRYAARGCEFGVIE